ncbi:unnamed protein product [Vitrella brassicaformis CCMP3155]|uniref:Uncharacterized protein n=1 Tax=Vitrella brassicaformis (strain CCMP3155) TaxID=1169540 RepID=A0A0G4GMT2_VITBC|nr:unnamed protein product [Vitrella brassicaformis CCMP3155]|eukprot:CEM31511.1 unnamed protein product [Vitrella brassicaformis CCMP3155]
MPREVPKVAFGAAVGAEDRIGVLEALAGEREVYRVYVGDEEEPVSLTQGGAFDGWGSNNLPSIRTVHVHMSVPDEVEDTVAGELIRDGLTSLLDCSVQGLQQVLLWLPEGHDDLGDAIRQCLHSRVGDFDITFEPDGPWVTGIEMRAIRRS